MRTYVFLISLLSCVFVNAQEKVQDSSATKKHRYGLRVGADISKFIKTALNKNYTGFEINADYRFSKRYYIAGEIGNEQRTIDDVQVNLTTKGNYIKIGVDYNAYENWLDMENAIFAGLRYGFSTFSHTLNSYSIYNTDQYWGENTLNTTPKSFDNVTAHWVELIVGFKVEIFNNLYLGLNAQLKNVIVNDNPTNFKNLQIPGFGRTYEDSNWGVGFGYTVSYFIPLYKR